MPTRHLRVTAYRALKQNHEAVLQLAKIAVDDPSPAVRREVAISLRDIPWEECKELIKDLIAGYDGEDRWYLEALGMAMQGKETLAYDDLVGKSTDPTTWSKELASIIWRIHPKTALPALKELALARNTSENQRELAVNAIAFVRDSTAVDAMIQIGREHQNDAIGQLANWWISHRKNNDWFGLWDWTTFDKENNPGISEETALLQEKVLDGNVPIAQRIKAAKELGKSLEGARFLIGLAADQQLNGQLIEAVSETINTHPNLEIRTLGKAYFNDKEKNQLSDCWDRGA